MNIAAIPEQLIESTLFGHEKGAFTGATATKIGLFELAQGGDLFMDEIGDASPSLQQKLLKVIEEREYYRVGGENKTPLKTNARFIFATNRNLEEMVRQGAFRLDLCGRISMAAIQIPTLEERKEDIPDLCRVILKRLELENPSRSLKYDRLPEDFKAYLERDNIEMNLRGIQSDLSRIFLFSNIDKKGRVDATQWKATLGISKRGIGAGHKPIESLDYAHLAGLPTSFLTEDFPGIKMAKALVEKRIIEEAHKKFNGNAFRMAKAIRISPSNVKRKVEQYLDRPAKAL